MDINQQVLLKLLSSALHKKNIDENLLESADLKAVLETAKEHQVHTIIFPVLKGILLNESQKSMLISLEKITLKTAIRHTNNYEKIKDVIKLFNDNSINVVALKGLIIRSLYEYPELRTMGDVDFLINSRDMKLSVDLLKNEKYIESERDFKHIHLSNSTGYDIELHRSLVNKRFLGDFPGFDAKMWKNLIKIQLDDVPVLSLSVQNQMLYMCVHLAGHFLQDGFGLRQLCDIVLFIKKYKDEIIWEQFYNELKEYKIYGFVRALLLTCHIYLSMDLPDGIEYYKNLDETYVSLMLNDILSGGTFGVKTLERVAANKRVNNYKRKEKSYVFPKKLKSMIILIFPSNKLLGDRYYYARKVWVLTPIAWIHRLIYDGLIKRKFTMKEKMELLFSDKSEIIFRERIKLLHWMDL